MPHPPRVIVPGETYHLFTRGSNKLPVYFEEDDYVDFLGILANVVRRDTWKVLAYCLMPNHFHLLVTPDVAGISNGMRELNGGFSRRTSLKYGRTAHLFKNRFGDRRMTSAGQLIYVARYIVLNPVAAGICAHPRQWRWSSYRATAGYERRPPWLDVKGLLEHFSAWGPDPKGLYRRYVDEGLRTVSDTADPAAPATPKEDAFATAPPPY